MLLIFIRLLFSQAWLVPLLQWTTKGDSVLWYSAWCSHVRVIRTSYCTASVRPVGGHGAIRVFLRWRSRWKCRFSSKFTYVAAIHVCVEGEISPYTTCLFQYKNIISLNYAFVFFINCALNHCSSSYYYYYHHYYWRQLQLRWLLLNLWHHQGNTFYRYAIFSYFFKYTAVQLWICLYNVVSRFLRAQLLQVRV